jgi:hypothetical protein
MTEDKFSAVDIYDRLQIEPWIRTSEMILVGRGGTNSGSRPAQNREEIVEFMEVMHRLLPKPPISKVALEIGLDQGGTHRLLRHLFGMVISIDSNADAVLRFSGGIRGDVGTKLIIGNSAMPGTVRTLCNVLQSCSSKTLDLLFIDGDHSYAGVESDYINYEPFVGVGGIVAFHDAVGEHVKLFLEHLATGKTLMGIPPIALEKIQNDKNPLGIAYYVKKG